MATRYVDTDTGSDSNGGTSWADAWLSWDKIVATVVDGDVVYHRGAATMTSTYLNAQSSISAGFSLIRDPASFSTKTKVLLGLNADTRYVFSDSVYFQGLEFTLDYNNPTANYNNTFLRFLVSNRANKVQDCKFIPINTNDLYYSRPIAGSVTGPIFISCEFDGSLSKNCILMAIGDVSFINCDVHDFKEEPGVWPATFCLIQTSETSSKIFENNRFWNISVPRIFRETLSAGELSNYLIRYNTFYFNSSYQNQDVNLMSSNGAEYSWSSFNLHDNVIVSENATYDFKINDTSTVMEAPVTGYNAISSNIDLTNYSPTFSDTIITAADFASTNPVDADFLQPAASSTLEELTGFLPNRTPGFYQVAGGGAGGETDPDKVLSTSTEISGNINPNTVLDTNANGTLDSANVLVAGGGDYVEPDNSFYSPNGPGYGDAGLTVGTQDLPEIVNIAPDDTLEGTPGIMDLPALNRVSPNDTLRGFTGTQDLPTLSSIKDSDTLEGTPGTLPSNKIAPSQGGSYLGEEDNDVITADILKVGEIIENLGVSVEGTFSGASVTIPDNKVVYPFEYIDAEGSKTGQFGLVSPGDDIASNIKTNLLAEVDTILTGLTYTPLSNIYEIEKNNFKQNTKRYGVRILGGVQTIYKVGAHVTDQNYEIILTTNYINGASGRNDEAQQAAVAELLTRINKIYRRILETKGGSASNVLIVNEGSIQKPEFIAEQNVAIVRLQFNVRYKQNR